MGTTDGRTYGPWLNTPVAADYLAHTGKQPLRSVYRFMNQHGIVARHDGGTEC